MWFDVQAALKEIESGSPRDTRDIATNNAKTAQIRDNVAEVADVATLVKLENAPDIDAFEERAAIVEYDGGLSRAAAEAMAAQCQGFDNVVAFKAAAGDHQKDGSDSNSKASQSQCKNLGEK